MESFNFHDIRVEKANAISRYRRIQRITFSFRGAFCFPDRCIQVSTQFALSPGCPGSAPGESPWRLSAPDLFS
ncbi:UNVERIFIED_CONTAM: hypothetical protein Sangu_2511400 [Sesamum angustifolium]|uniref:Uncharacterized protein n=1 Tax=Sesamum angustifolium TaxID=2727405 RepID=A0AAW2JL89_9LAMI